MDIPSLYNLFIINQSISTDTRSIKKGDIFFALKGPSFNGNKFISQALEAGASFCVSDDPDAGITDKRVITVNDSLVALQLLAKFHRSQFSIPFIAITGTNGKTTTKEMVHAVLSAKYKTYTTSGNLNNHIGIPITLLSIKKDAEFAVIEMGANHIGEIAGYCEYVMPTHGLITNCGKAHLEGFGSEEGVKKAKGELFDYLRDHKGTAFVSQDYDYLQKMSAGIPHIISYGKKNAGHTGEISGSSEFLTVSLDSGLKINTNLVGDYNFSNIMAAVAIGRTFKVAEETIKTALENYSPTNSRSQLVIKNGNRFVMDAYNANPSSMAVAIDNFSKIVAPHKIMIIGAMKELGESSIDEHRLLLNKLNSVQSDQKIVVGNEFTDIPVGILHFSTAEEVKNWLNSQKFEDYLFLVKGSRGVQLEKVLE